MFKSEADFEKVVSRLRIDTEPNPVHRENLRRQMLSVFNETGQQPQEHITPFGVFRRTIMRNTFTKIAAAVAVISAVLIGLHFLGSPFGTTPTFAQVIQPILSARTVSLDILIGQTVIHDDVMGPRIRRTVSGMKGADIIIDFEQQKLLTIDHGKKTAVYMGLRGLPDLRNYVEMLRDLITSLQSEPDFQVENRGAQEIQGRDCLVFVVSAGNETITIWADPKTALPFRIEQKTPNMLIACDNLQFDVAFNESLFSMEAPEGYVVQDAGGIDFSESSESAFIETLRIWAEIIEGGQFPESINLEDVVKIGPKFDQGMKRAGLTDQQQTEVAMRWGQGLVFIRFFKGQGQWHYAGAGVKLGDGEKPIFWYQPQGSQTWRVIYGNLHVEDVEEQHLPNPALSGEQTKILESSRQWEKQEFVGTEKDLWHVTAAGEIAASSYITLIKVPQNAGSMYVKLPYAGAVLRSVTLDDQEIPFTALVRDRYEIHLPPDKLAQSKMNLTCSWAVSMEALEKTEDGYRIKLQGLIPVTGFTLTAVLEEDCGLKFPTKYVNDPTVRSLNLFTRNDTAPAGMNLGTCGLPVNKSD
jgi:hypothetical protein